MLIDNSILKMREIAKDIINHNKYPYKDYTHKESMQIFHKIMRKHGIKQGEWSEGGGRIVSNFEWIMCKTLFLDTVMNNKNMSMMFDDIPNDLMAYGKKPKTKKS